MFRYLLILGEKLLVIFKDFRNVKVKCEKTVVDWCKEWGYFAFVYIKLYYSSVQSLSCVRLFATPWTAACQASLSIANSQSLLKLMSIELVMPSNHLILCCPLLLLPSIFIRVFSNESVLCIRWPKYWSFSFNISPSNEYSGLISFRIDWFDLLAVQGTLKEYSSAAHFTLWDHNLDNHLKLDSSPPRMYYWAAMPQYMYV